MIIPLSNPDITNIEKNKVMEVLSTPSLSLGPKLEEFEEKFSAYIGSKYAVAVNSGTNGLHLCLRSLDIKDGDKVLTTPFSFISSANCILFDRAEPVFVDIDEKTLNIDINKIVDKLEETNRKNLKAKAVLPVHIFGRPCEMNDVMSIAQDNELKVIEDAAEAIGSKYRTEDKEWKKVGTFGDCGVFAFYPNKQITTGEGGMIVTDDENIYKLCRSMRNQGRSEDGAWLQHERLGFNYRISDINCALGIAQLDRIKEIIAKREHVTRAYNQRLKDVEEVTPPHFEDNKKISWFVYVVRLIDRYSREDRDLILNKLKEKGIECSNYFTPIHLQPFYKKMFGYKKGDYPVTEKVSKRTIALPFYNNLKESQIDYVCDNLIEIIKSI